MPVEVKISNKHRSLPIPAGTKELIEKALEKAGFGEADFKMCGGPRIRGTPHNQGVKIGPVKGHSVVVRVQPGNNNTRTECMLYVPKDLDPEEVRERLLSASEPGVVTEGESTMPNGHRGSDITLPDPADVWGDRGQNGEVVKDDSVPPPQPAPVKNLRGFMRQLDTPNGDIGLVMLAVHERWKLDQFCGRDCAEVIKDVCQLNGASAKSLGAVMGHMVSRGYLERVRVSPKGRHLYHLGPKGRQLVGDDTPSGAVDETRSPIESDGLQDVLTKLGDLQAKAHHFRAALAAKEAIGRERENLQFRLEELSEEEKEAMATLSDPELQEAARKVQEIGAFLAGNKNK